MILPYVRQTFFRQNFSTMQKTFFKTRIIIELFCTFLLVTLLTYCKKELPNPPVNGNPPDTALRTDCKLYMSYEVETTRLIRPLNEADFQILSTVDKAITLPQRDRYLKIGFI